MRAVVEVTAEVGRAGSSLRGVAADEATVYAALSEVPAARRTMIEARQGDTVAWRSVITGSGGPIVRTTSLVVVALAADEPTVRGTPGAIVSGLDPSAGTIRWTVPFGATGWTIITALAATADDGAIVVGSFSGTLKVGAHVVGSGGDSDGFVAALGAGGDVRWLVRLGGPGPDAVQGVATRGSRIAIAGTFTAGADLQGEGLPAWDERLPFSDVFVAELDATGGRVWSSTFGGKDEDSAMGVAIDSKGRVAVAAAARGSVRIAGLEHVPAGSADGLVAWFGADGTSGPVQLIGGTDADGLRAIAAVGDVVVVGGYYAGSMVVGDSKLEAGGGDGAFLAALDPQGALAVWDLGGAGREEVAALAAIPGTAGFIAGVAHTAELGVGSITLPAPADPLAGAAIVIRAAPATREP